ncbi:MAG: hypothetical protein ACXWKN_06140 [Phenylobacterium sp.]
MSMGDALPRLGNGAKPAARILLTLRLSAITSPMVFARDARALFIGLIASAAVGHSAHAEPLSACIWGKLSPAEQTRVLAAYQDDMASGAAALDRLGRKLQATAANCAKRSDIPADWIQTIAGSEAVQVYAAEALAVRRLDRARLDAAWAAAPADVAACVRANGRLAFFSNGLGCSNPAASAWLLKRLGLDPNQQPAARQALYYFNARAIGEWGDRLVAGLANRPKP